MINFSSTTTTAAAAAATATATSAALANVPVVYRVSSQSDYLEIDMVFLTL
jgi:hypothetical protein